MKAFILVFLWSLLLTSVAPSQLQITVSGGHGGGVYKARPSRTVNIWAAANPPNMVFDKWIGDSSVLADDKAWHTTVALQQGNISLTATYKSAPDWNPVFETISGSTYGYYLPLNLLGLVFRFHGGGGSGNSFFTKTEDRITANDLVASNFGVISLDSANRVDKQWSTGQPPNNPDINNVQALINVFISRGLITSATPIFTLGMSNGGAFAPRAAYWLSLSGLNMRGVAVYCAQGNSFAIQTNVPTIWNLAQNDDSIGATGNQGALTAYQTLSGRGIAAQYHLSVPSPVYPQRFARIKGLTASDSQIIYDSLKINGFLARFDLLSQNPNLSNWQNFIPAAYNSYRGDISDELSVSYSGHQFFSDNDSRIITFFNAQIP